MIEFREVGKVYTSLFGRSVRAVEAFSLCIQPGEVLGIAGPNGAGKSTLIALLLGYLKPTEGTVTIQGQAPRQYIERHGIGYLSELVAVPPKWTLADALSRYAVLAGIPGARVAERRDAVIAQLGLEEHRAKKIRQLSKGNLQRLGLGQALLRDEDILVLDEPTHGLDPVWTQRFRDLVHGLRRPGRTILIASHNLDELERVADRVAIIDRGRLQRLVVTRGASTFAAATTYQIALAAGGELVERVFPGARPLGNGVFAVSVEDVAVLNRGVAALIAGGALLTALTPAYSALEQQFREAIGEQVS